MDKEAAAKLREQLRPHLKDFLRNGNVDLYPPALTVCPHCGAPVKGTGEKTCPYCGSPVQIINIYAWSFADIKETK